MILYFKTTSKMFIVARQIDYIKIWMIVIVMMMIIKYLENNSKIAKVVISQNVQHVFSLQDIIIILVYIHSY
jgi:hypothetical protein